MSNLDEGSVRSANGHSSHGGRRPRTPSTSNSVVMRSFFLAVCLSLLLALSETKAQRRQFVSADRRTSGGLNAFDDLLEEEKRPEPVPILRYVDRQNSDGSYTYGFENGDGTYKIETRYATGEVKGKYGYYDPSGQLREVEYGAKPNRGFEPRADGLVVPPPTIPEEESGFDEGDSDFSDNQSTLLPQSGVKEEAVERRSGNRFANFRSRSNQQEEVVVVRRRRPDAPPQPVVPVARPQPRPEPVVRVARPQPRPEVASPVQRLQPSLRSQQAVSKPSVVSVNPEAFQGHPATNIDLNKGSYSFSYSG